MPCALVRFVKCRDALLFLEESDASYVNIYFIELDCFEVLWPIKST